MVEFNLEEFFFSLLRSQCKVWLLSFGLPSLLLCLVDGGLGSSYGERNGIWVENMWAGKSMVVQRS